MAGAPGTWDPTAPLDGSTEDWLAWANALPLSRELGMVCTDIGEGHATFTIATTPMTANPNGAVNGGLVAAAADQCMGAVSMTVLGSGLVVATASLHIQYLRSAMPPLTMTARVTKSGRTLVFVDVDIEEAEGRHCNGAQGTMMIVPLSPPTVGQSG